MGKLAVAVVPLFALACCGDDEKAPPKRPGAVARAQQAAASVTEPPCVCPVWEMEPGMYYCDSWLRMGEEDPSCIYETDAFFFADPNLPPGTCNVDDCDDNCFADVFGIRPIKRPRQALAMPKPETFRPTLGPGVGAAPLFEEYIVFTKEDENGGAVGSPIRAKILLYEVKPSTAMFDPTTVPAAVIAARRALSNRLTGLGYHVTGSGGVPIDAKYVVHVSANEFNIQYGCASFHVITQ